MSSHHPPCAISHLPPQIVIRSTLFPLQPSQLVHCTPKPTAQDQASPHHISQHQKHKTLLLFVAHVTHCPWPSPLKVWTLSCFRRISAGYGLLRTIHTPFDISFCFTVDVPLSILQLPLLPLAIPLSSLPYFSSPNICAITNALETAIQ